MSPAKSRIGFHYFPDDHHYTQRDLDAWLPILQSLDAHWIALQAPPGRAIPEDFLRPLIERGMEPILHMPATVGSLSIRELAPLFQAYATWGVRHVVLYDRPNMRSSWTESGWLRGHLVERFIDHILPMLRLQRKVGLVPTFPPLTPGGDYWDTAFLGLALESLQRRGEREVLDSLALAFRGWTYGRPLDWGTGGQAAWPDAMPYRSTPGTQDHLGFRIFEWYAEICRQVFDRELPMIAIAGGAILDPEAHPRLERLAAEKTEAIVRWLQGDEVPESLVGYCFYPLSADASHAHHPLAWYRSPQEPAELVEACRRALASVEKRIRPAPKKIIRHYVLMPQTAARDAHADWDSLAPFAMAIKPTLGFSAEEARLAERVTLLGDRKAIPEEHAEDLRASGCEVLRIDPRQEGAILQSIAKFATAGPSRQGA